jgi:hypothetical protein
VERPPHFAFAVAFVFAVALAFLVVIPEGDLLLSLPLPVLLLSFRSAAEESAVIFFVLLHPTRIATKAVN